MLGQGKSKASMQMFSIWIRVYFKFSLTDGLDGLSFLPALGTKLVFVEKEIAQDVNVLVIFMGDTLEHVMVADIGLSLYR